MATVLQPPTLKVDERYGDKLHAWGRVERRIVWNLIHYLAAAGFRPESVGSDEDVFTDSPEAMMEEVFNLDEARVWFRKTSEHSARWVMIVLGNGPDCVSDWGVPRDDHDGFAEAMEAFDAEQYA